MRLAPLVLACVCAGPAMSEILDLPSGTQAALHEVLIDQVGDEDWLRFRLVAPVIDRTRELAPGYADLEADFPHICTTFALPYAQEFALDYDKIAISISDRVVEFGTTDPDATQYFEVFRPENADCIWEGF